jgi:acetyltransferase
MNHPAALYPSNLTFSWPLLYGQSITIRPLRPDDIDTEHAFVVGLSAETRYNRMLGAGSKLSRAMLERLTRVDFRRDMALAASVIVDDSESFAAVARYVMLEDNQSCEFALVVADAWQGRGLGEGMLMHLIYAARRAGICRIYGDVFASNAPMLRLAAKLGFHIGAHDEGAQLRRISLDAVTVASPSAPAAYAEEQP